MLFKFVFGTKQYNKSIKNVFKIIKYDIKMNN